MHTAFTKTASLAFAALTLAAGARAQAPLEFTIDQGASNWSWSATTSLGPINGIPNNNLQVSGNQSGQVARGNWPIASGQWLGGSANVATIQAEIPNPLTFLPPLAELEIVNLSMSFSSSTFAIASNGTFTTNITTSILSGTVTVDPLTGSTTVTDLAGSVGDPQLVTGAITQSGNTVHFDLPMSASFDFTDAGSGLTASMTIGGVLVGDYDCVAPASYCDSNLNSVGQVATFSVNGSTRIQDNAMQFDVVGLPLNKFGYFLMSNTQANIPGFGGSQGVLCLGSPLVRFAGNVLNSGGAGTMSFTPDMTNLPGGVAFDNGESWNFQLWYRDNNPGSTSNTSNGVNVVFCP